MYTCGRSLTFLVATSVLLAACFNPEGSGGDEQTESDSTGSTTTTDLTSSSTTATTTTTTATSSTTASTTASSTTDPSGGSSGGSCPEGTADCGSGNCDIDTTSDPLNCGACGHDCLGADCTDSLCESQQVYLRTDLATIGIDDQYLYALSGNNSGTSGHGDRIARTFDQAPEDLGLPVTDIPRDMIVDTTRVFFGNWATDGIVSMNKDGGDRSVLYDLDGNITVLDTAASSAAIYAEIRDSQGAMGSQYAVYVVNKDGGGLAVVDGFADTPIGQLVSPGESAFWTRAGSIWTEGVAIASEVLPDVAANDLAADGSALFYTATDTVETLYRANLDGTGITVIATADDEMFNQIRFPIAQDGVLVWFDQDDANNSILRMANQDGTGAMTLGPADGANIVMDDIAIFWRNSPEVRMVARP